MQTGVIILAAGSSTRMGESKQLLKVNGTSLLERTILVAQKVCSRIVVVLGSQFENHRKSISHLPVDVIENKRWATGMGSSLKMGLIHLESLGVDGALILVCDQPLLSAQHLEKLVQASKETEKPMGASSYHHTVGIPAFFKKSIFHQLRQLDDQAGAKKIIYANPELVAAIDFPEGAIDIDTRGDYEQFISDGKIS